MKYLCLNIPTLAFECELIEFVHNGEIIKIAAHPNDYITSVISGQYPPPQHDKTFYDIKILEYVKSKYVGGVALDIGANIGNHTVYYSKFIFDKVFSFEANLKNFALISENKRINGLNDDKLIIHHTGLSDGYYKFKSREIYGNMGGNKVIEGDGDLITKKLDDFDLPKIDFIKMDVEGHELKVLKGGINLINRDFPDILLECNEKTDSDYSIINPYMLSLNYELIPNYYEMKSTLFGPNFYYTHNKK